MTTPAPAPQPHAGAPATKPAVAPAFASILKALLKHPRAFLAALADPARTGPILLRLAGIILVAAALYGVVMGSLSGGPQLWAAPAKLAAGLLCCIVLCLPSLYIFVCLDGADLRLAQVAGALLGMVALLTILLIGFAPVAWIFSQSTDSIVLLGCLHLLFWLIGLKFGLRLIAGLLDLCHLPDRGHLKVWIAIFVLVSLQMSTVLRPLIGTADTLLPTEKKFFVQHWMDNLNTSRGVPDHPKNPRASLRDTTPPAR